MTETTARSPEAPERATTSEDLRARLEESLLMIFPLSTAEHHVDMAEAARKRIRDLFELALADELDSPPSMQEIREAMHHYGHKALLVGVSIGEQEAFGITEQKKAECTEAFDALLSLISRRLQETSEPKKILERMGIERDEFGRWFVSAEPGPVECETLDEAIDAFGHLGYNDALNEIESRYPARDIPIRFSSVPRAIRRWQIDVEYSGNEPPHLRDVLESSERPHTQPRRKGTGSVAEVEEFHRTLAATPSERSTRKDVEDELNNLKRESRYVGWRYAVGNTWEQVSVIEESRAEAAARQRLLDLYKEEPRFTERDVNRLREFSSRMQTRNGMNFLRDLAIRISSSLTATRKEPTNG